MIKKLLSLVALFALSVSMFAITNMCVKLNDGTVVKYNIDDVEEVYYEGEETQEIVTCVKQKDGSVVRYGIGNIDEVYYEDEDETKDREEQEDSHESVDLGLPSGLKWATMNVGASKPEEFGDYFAWGEVAPAPNNEYTEANGKVRGNYHELNEKGVLGEYGNLGAKYDAATVNWGENWRMPSKQDFDELIDNCTWTRITLGDTEGYKVESKVNSNWIFIPGSGYHYKDTSDWVGVFGYYWSSSIYGESSRNSAYYLDFGYFSVSTESSVVRWIGYSVRPVAK